MDTIIITDDHIQAVEFAVCCAEHAIRCDSNHSILDTQNYQVTDAISSIKKWLYDPSEENRKLCHILAKNLGITVMRMITNNFIEKAAIYAVYTVSTNDPKLYRSSSYGSSYYSLLSVNTLFDLEKKFQIRLKNVISRIHFKRQSIIQ